MKESDHVKLRCPFSYSFEEPMDCIGSKCAAWNYLEKVPYTVGDEQDWEYRKSGKKSEHGYCALIPGSHTRRR